LTEKGIETLTLDVTRPESIANLKTEIATRTGDSLDILFNNAGACKSPVLARFHSIEY
jgi:1-acylglycerone phosphate reductase